MNKALLNVRERLSVEMMKSSTPSAEQNAEVASPAPRTDIQAILTVLGRTKQRGEDSILELDLRQTDLQGAHLLGDLRRVRLYKADLRGAHLFGTRLQRADFQEANLYKIDLRGANSRKPTSELPTSKRPIFSEPTSKEPDSREPTSVEPTSDKSKEEP